MVNRHVQVSRYLIALGFLVLVLPGLGVREAHAYNVPGSTNLILPSVVRETGFAVIEASEEATVASIDALQQSGGAADPPLAFAPNVQTVDPTRFALAYGPEDSVPRVDDRRFAFGVNVKGRHLEDAGDELPFDYDLFVGAVALTYRATPSLYLTLTGIADGGFGDTDFNDGTINHIAGGGSGTITWYPNDNFRFMLSGGYSRLQYDVDRSNGAIDGSFGADRVFGDSNVSLMTSPGGASARLSGGLRYLQQWNEGYTETGPGGGVVGDSDIAFLRAYGELEIGYDFGVWTPFTIGRAGYDVFVDDSAPTAALQVFESDLEEFTAAFGGGLKGDLGVTKLKVQGDVRLTGDEYSGYSGSARLGVPF